MTLRVWHLLAIGALLLALPGGRLLLAGAGASAAPATAATPAELHTAEARLRAALGAVASYDSDNFGSSGDVDRDAYTTGYGGMTAAVLRVAYGASIDPSVDVASASATSYCVQASSGGVTVSKAGPAAPVIPRACR